MQDRLGFGAVLAVCLLACGAKAPPSADCDAFAVQYGAAISTPTDGDLTKKAIELQVRTLASHCRSDHWSAALASCITSNAKADIFKSCANAFSPEQSQHLEEVLHRQADGVRDAIRTGTGAP